MLSRIRSTDDGHRSLAELNTKVEILQQENKKSGKLLEEEREKSEKWKIVADMHRHIIEDNERQNDENARKLEEKTREVEELSEELLSCKRDYKDLQYQFGRWWIDRCGIDAEYRNKSVKVQFVALGDRELAEKTKELFSIAWHVVDIEHIRWKPNPSSDRRIVVFSNDENAGGVRSAINDYNLLGERVTRRHKGPDMENDMTIVIFPEKGSRD